MVANGVETESVEDGVHYMPLAQAAGMKCEALWIERFSTPPGRIMSKRIVVRATDIDWDPYKAHRALLASGASSVIVNTKWALEQGFSYAKEKIIIPPSLDYDLGGPAPEKVPGRFVFASAPMKGLDLSLDMWRKIVKGHNLQGKVHLKITVPGFSDMYGDKAKELSEEDKALGIEFEGMISIIEWRRLIASAEGLFFVSQMNETFGCVAAFAEKYGTRTHIWCRAQIAGFAESITNHEYVTQDEWVFEKAFVKSIGRPAYFVDVMDRSPDALAPMWEKALHLPDRTGGDVTHFVSGEDELPQEDLPENKPDLPPEFGKYLSVMRRTLACSGSEYGLGLMLMSLVASTRAERCVEIGRFKGFATVSMAAGLALIDAGWRDTEFAKQRPDVDYPTFLAPKTRKVISIENNPRPHADAAMAEAGLEKYYEKIDQASDDVDLKKIGPIDVLLIDGDHDISAIRKDIARYVPLVKPGGYFVLHDYFGWYDKQGRNNSHVKRAVDEELEGFERVLIDTGFMSFVILRKTIDLLPTPDRVPPREDKRPTVGLVLIAHGDEASTIIARAIVSANKTVDAVTVVLDGGDKTAEVCRALGADVYVRKTPPFDWEKGDGSIARARNEALAIAERRTDYVMLLDPDDYYEGELPKELTADLYEVFVMDSGLRYPRVQLFKSGKGFRYAGIAHEHLVCAGSIARIDQDKFKYIRGYGGTQDRNHPTVKFAIHARWFEKWLVDHPDDPRSQFYLAQSYRDSRQFDKAIIAYERRIEMTTGQDEERAFSACQIARILRETGKDPTQAYLRAYEMRPTRAEPLCELANWLRDEKQKRFALAVIVARMAASLQLPPHDYLFIEPSVYEYRALEELAIALYWSGDKVGAKTCYEQLLTRVPKGYVEHISRMLAMTEEQIKAGK